MSYGCPTSQSDFQQAQTLDITQRRVWVPPHASLRVWVLHSQHSLEAVAEIQCAFADQHRAPRPHDRTLLVDELDRKMGKNCRHVYYDMVALVLRRLMEKLLARIGSG